MRKCSSLSLGSDSFVSCFREDKAHPLFDPIDLITVSGGVVQGCWCRNPAGKNRWSGTLLPRDASDIRLCLGNDRDRPVNRGAARG